MAGINAVLNGSKEQPKLQQQRTQERPVYVCEGVGGGVGGVNEYISILNCKRTDLTEALLPHVCRFPFVAEQGLFFSP